jgi:CheY-like chemotaxis protein
MDEPSVLLVGTEDDAARSSCAAALADLPSLAQVEHVADLRAAAARLAEPGATFEVVAIAEPRPGQYSNDEIDALRKAAPLVRVWRLLGSWCEGEQRSGRPPLGCIATYWHRLPARLSSELEAARRGRCPTWGLPLTATPDERLSAAACLPNTKRLGQIVVCGSRSESAAALADACRLGGYETQVALAREQFAAPGAAAVVWDTSIEPATDARRVEQLRRAAGGAPVVAVVGFPREQMVRRALAAGVADVVSKPYRVCDLLWQVRRAVEARR